MAYRVDLTERAARDLKRNYRVINAADSAQAHAWFNGLERVILSLDERNASRAPAATALATVGRHAGLSKTPQPRAQRTGPEGAVLVRYK